MKDDRNHHGAVDKSYLEQRIHIVDANYIFVRKIGPVHVPELGLTADRWQADGMQVTVRRYTGEFGNY